MVEITSLNSVWVLLSGYANYKKTPCFDFLASFITSIYIICNIRAIVFDWLLVS